MSGSQQTLPLSTIFPINSVTNPTTHFYLHLDSSYSAHRLSEAASVKAAPRTAPQATRQARRLVGPSYQLLDPGPLTLLSPHTQSTRRPSPKRYHKRYERDLLETCRQNLRGPPVETSAWSIPLWTAEIVAGFLPGLK